MKTCNDIRINLEDLHPLLRYRLNKALKLANKAGIYIIITEGYRTVKYQDELYAKGRTAPGTVVTFARGKDYNSQHQWHIAFDIAINGNLSELYNSKLISEFAKYAKKAKLGWGGDWTGFKDTPHFYLKKWGCTPAKLKKKYGTPEKFKKQWFGRILKKRARLYFSKDMNKKNARKNILPVGAKVNVLYTKGLYAKVEYSGIYGYIYKKKLKGV